MKYIIEIEDVPFSKVRIDDNGAQNINLYRAKGFNSLVFDKNGLDKLTPLNEELIKSYLEGCVDQQKETAESIENLKQTHYKRGLNDAWKAITKIAKMPDGERMTHFGEVWISNILNTYSLDQIFTILEKNESEPDEIKVGDDTLQEIEQLPSAQPQRTGYWINKYLHKGNIRECSVCHVTQSVTVYDGKVMFKFCPYCGMKVLEGGVE